MYTHALACVKTSPFFFVAKGKGNRRPPDEDFSSTKSFRDGGIYNTCFLLLRRKSVPGVRIVDTEWSAAPRKRARNTPYPTPSFFSALISLHYPQDLNAWNRPLRRLRVIALLSSEPCAASENVKLCKLMVKRMRDFFARALALVPRSFAARHARVFSTYCE